MGNSTDGKPEDVVIESYSVHLTEVYTKKGVVWPETGDDGWETQNQHRWYSSDCKGGYLAANPECAKLIKAAAEMVHNKKCEGVE